MKRQETPHRRRLGPLYTHGMELREWVRAARLHAKMTQEQLGERLGVTKGNVSGWEHGRHAPGFKQVLKIEEVTGWPFDSEKPDDSAPPAISLTDALRVLDQFAQRASAQTRAELQKAFDLYLTDPRRYSRLMEDIGELLAVPPENIEVPVAPPAAAAPPEAPAPDYRPQNPEKGAFLPTAVRDQKKLPVESEKGND